jgi:hypothetical protein
VNAPHHLNPNAGEIEAGKDMLRGEKEVVAAQDPLVASHKLSTELQQAIGLAVIHAAACCSLPGDEPQPVSAPLTFRGACWAGKCCVCFYIVVCVAQCVLCAKITLVNLVAASDCGLGLCALPGRQVVLQLSCCLSPHLMHSQVRPKVRAS